MTRRQFLTKLTAATAAGAFMDMAGPVIEKAYAAGPCSGHVSDIEHFVLMLQGNRSFDHYFGTLSGVNGFDSGSPHFQQEGWNPQTQAKDRAGVTIPFRFDTTRGPLVQGECVNDRSRAGSRCTRNGTTAPTINGSRRNTRKLFGNIPGTMGYYTRADLPVHYMLADAFTICDAYHCSLLNQTAPNRLYWMSATIDPDGRQGGPVVANPLSALGKFTWRTMPKSLSDAGVSWKVYNNKAPGGLNNTPLGDNGMIRSFKRAMNPTSDLAGYGMFPPYPLSFISDVMANKLPQDSWVIPGILNLLRTLMSNPAVWEKTAVIISYDENGSFFDHVVPPTAPLARPASGFPTVRTSARCPGPAASGARSVWVIAFPAWSSRRTAGAAWWSTKRSTTPHSCDCSKSGSGRRCPTSPPGAEASPAT
jgi:phospholipase C